MLIYSLITISYFTKLYNIIDTNNISTDYIYFARINDLIV